MGFQNLSLVMDKFKQLLFDGQHGDEAAVSELAFDGTVQINSHVSNTVFNAVSMSQIASHLLHQMF